MPTLRQAWTLGGAKALTVSEAMRGSLFLKPHRIDTSAVGDGTNNSAVEASLSKLSNAVAEPPIGVIDAEDNEAEFSFTHPVARLLARPAPWLRGSLLTRYAVVAMNVHTHAAIFKVRNGAGRVVGLQPLFPMAVEPADGASDLATAEERDAHRRGEGQVLTHFVYRPMGGNQRRLEITDVVYLRQDVDLADPKRGRSKLSTALREVLQDEEAGLFAASLLSNMGIPGVMLTPEDPSAPAPTPDQAEQMAEDFYRKFSGNKRGRPAVFSKKMKPHVMGFNPEQMNFENLRRLPEERISAVLGVPAILAGLGAGLDSATYSNARTLREFFTEESVTNVWGLLGEEYTHQLLHIDYPDEKSKVTRFDLSHVRALQEDEQAKWTRYGEALDRGAITVAEYRTALGFEANPGDDVYLRRPIIAEVPSLVGTLEPSVAGE